jgi:hypothetical protein
MGIDFGDCPCCDAHAQVVMLDEQDMLQIAIRHATAQAARLREIVQITQAVQAAGIRVGAVSSSLGQWRRGGRP